MAWDPQLFPPHYFKKIKTCFKYIWDWYLNYFIKSDLYKHSDCTSYINQRQISNFLKKSNNRSKALTIKFFKSYTLRAQGLNFFYKSIFPLVAFLKPPFFSVSIFSVSSVQYLHYSLLLCMVPAECTSRRAFYDVMYRLWAWGAGKQIEMGYIR